MVSEDTREAGSGRTLAISMIINLKKNLEKAYAPGFDQVMCGMYAAHRGISRVVSGKWASITKHSTTMNALQKMYQQTHKANRPRPALSLTY
jgi:hypothetical protein